ncbi:serine palmitoyltransferase small subunit B [Bradysia coprophila]|uniref:serine palmitoyltransferase small subunit B n=1 Tax=Bradysia coprophila TaxID=38358 RepID=UPI00187D8F50|nr:serine palmitoyltransferase small subunit B [Bradysia coprophila]XP_037027142.1 serine palmitoyltransferase small subunit B [Bradysia coprophila]XP_037027143.1 serine palmitoyltransferase small subunit B [Bradysia coprophila]
MLDTAKNWLAYIYLQYEFSTCLYMFEPWERKAINTVVIAIIVLITFSSYMYLPSYTESLLNFLSSAPKQIDSHLQQPQIIPIIS